MNRSHQSIETDGADGRETRVANGGKNKPGEQNCFQSIPSSQAATMQWSGKVAIHWKPKTAAVNQF